MRGTRVWLAGSVCALAITLVTAATAAAAITVKGSVEQVYVTGATPGVPMSLVNSAGTVLATHRANGYGGVLYRNVAPGSGYRVRPAAGGTASVLATLMGVVQSDRLAATSASTSKGLRKECSVQKR